MVAYTVELRPAARRELRRLPKAEQQRVTKAIDGLQDEPRPHGCKALRGKRDWYRIRVGAYRVVYVVRDQELLVLVLRVAQRKDVYRNL
jgi:mRNA interferase RelE/StbE